MVKAVNKLMRAIETIDTALLAVMSVMVIMQIIWRYVLKSPLSWTDQMCRFFLVWSVMLGIPIIFNKHNGVAFDLLFNKTTGKTRKMLKLFICVLGAFFAVVFFLGGIDYCKRSGGTSVPGFPWMKFYMIYISEAIGAALLFIEMVKEFVEVLKESEETV